MSVCGSQILSEYQGQQCSVGMQAYQLQQKGATILDMCAHILTPLPTVLRFPHEGNFTGHAAKTYHPTGVDTAICFLCPCRRPAYQYEAERIEGAVNIPTFRPVAGRGKWDVIKKIAMGALAMRATGALHSGCWGLGH